MLAWIYLAGAGAAAGLLAGLFGVGGGIVVVPVLLLLLPFFGVPGEWLVHTAVGTSLATIVFTGASSVWRHHCLGAVQWPIVKSMAPGLIVGAGFGAWLTAWVPGDVLQRVIAVVILIVSVKMLFNLAPPAHWRLPGIVPRLFISLVIGWLSALCGVGGGSFMVPFLSACRVPMHNAVAVSAACGMPIAFFGMVGYVVSGMSVAGLPAQSLGYIFWPAALAIVVASIFFAQAGAKLAHWMPVKQLKKLFGLLLVVVGLRLLLSQ